MSIAFILMGVSGSGKSTIGSLLSQRLGDSWSFIDGDDYHPEANKKKMENGIPLEEEDRKLWLESLRKLIEHRNENNLIIACSALKKRYRKYLIREIASIYDENNETKDFDRHVYFIHLYGSFELIKERLEKRINHFFNPTLLKSQFDTLELDKDEKNIFSVDIDKSPEDIVNECIDIYKSIK